MAADLQEQFRLLCLTICLMNIKILLTEYLERVRAMYLLFARLAEQK